MKNNVYLKNIIKEVFKRTLIEGFYEDNKAKGMQIRDAIVDDYNNIFKNKYNVEPPSFYVTYSKDNLSIQSEYRFKNGLLLRATVLIRDSGGPDGADGAPQPTATDINYEISARLFAPKGHVLADNVKDVHFVEKTAGTGDVKSIKIQLGKVLNTLISKTQNVPTSQNPAAAQKPLEESLRRLLRSSKSRSKRY